MGFLRIADYLLQRVMTHPNLDTADVRRGLWFNAIQLQEYIRVVASAFL